MNDKIKNLNLDIIFCEISRGLIYKLKFIQFLNLQVTESKMNNYHIYEEVGRGKYSVVYKGRVKKSIKYVAVKSVERSRRRKLMNEVRIFHDLQHKNVLRFYNWYETRNHLWIIFEYCAGGDLYQLIEQDKRLPEESVRKFGYELVEGLSYLHANGIIYADLKPSNVLLNEYGALKFADFGLSKKLSDYNGTQESSAAGGTEAGKPKAGTPYYMAPELFSDSGVHSFYSDFWSLGCVLYELVAGRPPFSTNSLKDLIALIVEGEIPIPIEGVTCSQEFYDLLRKMLEKDPIKRINWDEIKGHPFWKGGNATLEFTKRVYPQQHQFDAYLRQRGIVPEHFYDQRNNSLIKQLGGPKTTNTSGGVKVDILRLSHNVRRNMRREQDDDGNDNINAGGLPSSTLNNAGSAAVYGAAIHSHAHQLNKQFSSGSGQNLGMAQPQIAPPTQSVLPSSEDQDDVSLNNNRRMVLNFGERADDEIDYPQPPLSQQQPSGGGGAIDMIEVTIGNTQNKASSVVNTNNAKPTQSNNDNNNFVPLQMNQAQQAKIPQFYQQQQQDSQQQQFNIANSIEDEIAQPIGFTIGKKQSNAMQQQIQQKQVPPQQQQLQPNLFSKVPTQQQTAQQAVLTKPLPSMATVNPQSQKDLMMLINQQVFTQQSQFSKTVSANSNTLDPLKSPPQIPVKTIDQLLMHNSDTAVKPIIGNKEIEKLTAGGEPQTPQYDPTALSFEPLTPELVLQNIEQPQIEGHLNDLFTSISSPHSSINEKVHALLYFESIIVNSQVSNRLINSAFMNLLVKMLKTVKTPQIRVRVCSVIGLLVRHSTVIENDVAESEVCSQLVEVLQRDKNEKVRRKAVAALGEYMFYAATQLDDEQADQCWEIRDDAINCIIKCLRVDLGGTTNVAAMDIANDETVVFYAVKTLENITAQSNSAGGRFASVESANYLLQIFLGIHTPGGNQIIAFNNENLRTSAAVALSHICRLQPKLFPLVFNKITPRLFCYTLSEGQARVQQAFLTLLNQALSQNIYPKINEILLRLDQQQDAQQQKLAMLSDSEEISGQGQFGFLPCLMKLLEHHSIVIRGKALLTFLLLFKQDFRWMAIVDPEVKFFHVLDRLSRDNYKYVQCCLLCLLEGILDTIPFIFSAISEELNIILNGGRAASIPSEFDRRICRPEFENLPQQGGSNMIYIAIILDLLQAQCVKARIVNYGFIRSIATLIDNVNCGGSDQPSSFQGAEEFLNALLLIVESISSSQKILLSMSDPIITVMLPVLLMKTKSNNGDMMSGGLSAVAPQSTDIRFLSLKIFTDIVIQYLNDESVYDPLKDASSPSFDPAAAQSQINQDATSQITAQQTVQTTRQLSELLQSQLFPRLTALLQDADPVPLFALKLLSAIVERNPPLFARLMRKGDSQLLSLIIENYQVGHPRLNRHTINIVKCVIQSKELSLIEIQHYRIGEKTYHLLKSAVQSKTSQLSAAQPMGDWCTEILLDVLQLLLAALIENIKAKENEVARLIDDVLSSFDLCVSLLNCATSNGTSGQTISAFSQIPASQPENGSTALIERGSQCLILMLQLYALCNHQSKKREIYFTESHLGHLINVLKTMSQAMTTNEKKIIVKRVLKCIYWALIQSEYQVRLKSDKRLLLDQLITSLIQLSDDRSIQNTSREIYKILREQYPQATGISPTTANTTPGADFNNSSSSGGAGQMIMGGGAGSNSSNSSSGTASIGGYSSNFYK